MNADTAPTLKPPCYRDDAVTIVRRLREGGHVAYFAGGCVRDLLLGLQPKDYDVATDAPPQRVRQLFANTQAVGAKFGVILVRLGRSVVEVATFRADGAYLDGRRPSEVRFTTAEEDARRRDFTINGLFLDPADGGDRVIDFVGGRADLEARRLRAIGNADDRFREDRLRLLRAVRFASRFGLEVEAATAEAIRRHAGHLTEISPERIADELRAMLTTPTRADAWRMLWDYGLIHGVTRFLPGSDQAIPSLNPGRSIFLALTPGKPISFGLALAAGTICYLWQQGRCATDVRPLLAKANRAKLARAMRQALRISNDELDEMTGTLAGLEPLLADAPPAVAAKKRFLATATAQQSIDLMRAMAAVGIRVERAAALGTDLAALRQGEYAPQPLITGDDLTAAGLQPGPTFRRVLDEVYNAQLEGRVGDRAAAMDFAMTLARRP